MTLRCTMILGDCLDVMQALPKVADFIFADIPYGVLSAPWDKRLPLMPFWGGALKARKHTCAICVMATHPYAAKVILSNEKAFSYDVAWIKGRGTGAFQAKKRPLRAHELALLFYANSAVYDPQMRPAQRKRRGIINKPSYPDSVFGPISANSYTYSDYVYPLSWLRAEPEHARRKNHSSQKPPLLMQWFVKSFTREGQTVLDPCSGSGSTAVASLSCGRNSVLIEKDAGYFESSVERIRKIVKDGGIDARVEVRR